MIDLGSVNTPDLKERLKGQLAMDVPDCEMVNGIVDELEKRDPIREIPIEVVVEWDRIKARKKQKAHLWKSWWKGAIAAVLAVALLGVVPKALGTENIFETVIRWTKDLFYFGETESAEFVFETDHPGLQELYDTVTELGVTKNVVPTWLPDGFILEKMESQISPKGIAILGEFSNEKSVIQIFVIVCNEKRDFAYQKDDGAIEVCEYGGVVTHIITNDGKRCAMWQMENVECAILVDAKEDIGKIIDSIYRSEKS